MKGMACVSHDAHRFVRYSLSGNCRLKFPSLCRTIKLRIYLCVNMYKCPDVITWNSFYGERPLRTSVAMLCAGDGEMRRVVILSK